MREISLERDREWFVIVTTRYRKDRQPTVKRTYLSADELAIIVELVKQALPPVTSAGAGGGPP